jgi:AsmA protein
VKRWTKILLALVGLFILVVASIPLFVNANTFRPTIERQLTTALGRSVKLGDLRLSVLSGSLVAKELSIADDPDFSATPFLMAKELRIGILLRPLIFSRQVNLQSFQIISPQITMIRGASGTWNFSSVGRPPAPGAPSGVAPNAGPSTPASGATADAAPGNSKSSTPQLPSLFVGRILIEDGRAVIASLPAHGDPSVYEHVNLAVHSFSFASQVPFELSADLPAGGTVHVAGHVGPVNRDDVATSPGDAQISVKSLDPVAAAFLDPNAGPSLLADIDVHAASDGQALTTSGTVHIEHLKLRKGAAAAPKPLDFTYNGTHRLKENTGQIEDASAKVGEAAIHVRGTYQVTALGVEDPLLELKLTGQSLPVDELQSLMTAAGVRLPNGAVLKGGTLAMNLAITGPVKSLVIAGPIALDNTRLVGFDLGSKVHGIAAMSGLKTGDTTHIEKLRANVHISNAGVVADKIESVIPAVGEVSGGGTVSPADQLDFKLVAKVSSAEGIGKVGAGLLTKLNGPSGASGKTAGVPLRVIGTPEKPVITADVNSIIEKKKKSIAAIFGKKK